MTIDIDAMRKQLGLTDIEKMLKEQQDREAAAEAKRLKEAQEAAEQARMKKLIDEATGETKENLQKALELVTDLDTKYKTDIAEGAKALKAQEETIISLQESIKQLMAARDGRNVVGDAVKTALIGGQDNFEKTAEDLVLLSYMMEKGVFETEHGKAHLKAVNDSSSFQMSSEDYETIFSTRMLRDLQKELVVGALFDELPMATKTLTMLIEPEAGEASWVDSSTYGTPATTGNEVKGAPTEISFRTFKLAAKSFLTDETEEDAIFTVLPIIRKRLIEAHAVSIEKSFMTGDGNGKPKGLLTLAKEDSKTVATGAKADGTVKVTSAQISGMRRHLGRHGLKLNKLVLIVSMDAYYDLLEDPEWQDVSQVGQSDSVKLSGQVGRIYGLPVVVSEYFPEKAADAEFAMIVYKDNFVVPRQRQVTVEKERQAERQRDAYFVTQRLNLQRYFNNGIVAAKYSA